MIDRKHFGVLLVSGAVALSAVVVALATASFGTGRTNDGNAPIVAVAVERQTSPPDADNDNDGLPNWKETLYTTDLANPDTDGDGMNDGDEVALGANPLVFGTEPRGEEAYVAPSALSPTEALARELFVSYAKLRTDGTVDPSEIDAAVESLLSRRIESGEEQNAPHYTLADVTAEEDVAIGAYAGALTAALKEADSVREYELSVFARVVEKDSELERQKLKASAALYASIGKKLLAMEVPPSLAGEHVALINGLSALAYEIERLSAWGSDPYEALLLLGAYGKAEDAMTLSMDDLFTLMASLQKET